MVIYAPLRMSAFEMLGASTISSTAFLVGSVCRDRRVYDSSCASLEPCKKEMSQNSLDRVHLLATQRARCRHWNNRRRSRSLRRYQSSNEMGPRINVLGSYSPRACTHFTS